MKHNPQYLMRRNRLQLSSVAVPEAEEVAGVVETVASEATEVEAAEVVKPTVPDQSIKGPETLIFLLEM